MYVRRTLMLLLWFCVGMSIEEMGVVKVEFWEWENSSKTSNSKIVHLAVPPAHFFIIFFFLHLHLIWFVSNPCRLISHHHISIVCHTYAKCNIRFLEMEKFDSTIFNHTVIAIKMISQNWKREVNTFPPEEKNRSAYVSVDIILRKSTIKRRWKKLRLFYLYYYVMLGKRLNFAWRVLECLEHPLIWVKSLYYQTLSRPHTK